MLIGSWRFLFSAKNRIQTLKSATNSLFLANFLWRILQHRSLAFGLKIFISRITFGKYCQFLLYSSQNFRFFIKRLLMWRNWTSVHLQSLFIHSPVSRKLPSLRAVIIPIFLKERQSPSQNAMSLKDFWLLLSWSNQPVNYGHNEVYCDLPYETSNMCVQLFEIHPNDQMNLENFILPQKLRYAPLLKAGYLCKINSIFCRNDGHIWNIILLMVNVAKFKVKFACL